MENVRVTKRSFLFSELLIVYSRKFLDLIRQLLKTVINPISDYNLKERKKFYVKSNNRHSLHVTFIFTDLIPLSQIYPANLTEIVMWFA